MDIRNVYVLAKGLCLGFLVAIFLHIFPLPYFKYYFLDNETVYIATVIALSLIPNFVMINYLLKSIHDNYLYNLLYLWIAKVTLSSFGLLLFKESITIKLYFVDILLYLLCAFTIINARRMIDKHLKNNYPNYSLNSYLLLLDKEKHKYIRTFFSKIEPKVCLNVSFFIIIFLKLSLKYNEYTYINMLTDNIYIKYVLLYSYQYSYVLFSAIYIYSITRKRMFINLFMIWLIVFGFLILDNFLVAQTILSNMEGSLMFFKDVSASLGRKAICVLTIYFILSVFLDNDKMNTIKKKFAQQKEESRN